MNLLLKVPKNLHKFVSDRIVELRLCICTIGPNLREGKKLHLNCSDAVGYITLDFSL